MSALSGVLTAAAEVEAFCRQQGWRFCFIGGLAVQRWGMPRYTQDVDLTLLTGFGSEGRYVDAVLERFAGRLRDARRFAMENRVLLVKSGGNVDIDMALGAFPFEEQTVERATAWEVSIGVTLTICSAEDLLVHKVFAGRDRDWADVESILARQLGNLNLAQVRRELPELLELKGEPESMERLERLIELVTRRRTSSDDE